MNIKITESNNYTKITIMKERFDVASMLEIKEEIHNVIETKHKIILDMSMVRFLDSSGLSVLISVLKSLKKNDDADLKLCELTEQPAELMEITQLYNVFDIVKDCSEL